MNQSNSIDLKPIESLGTTKTEFLIFLDRIKSDLRVATKRLSDRGLFYATRWAAELMVSIEDTSSVESLPTALEPIEDTVLLAKVYFDLHEYRRAYSVLEKSTSPIAIFLKYYSMYLAGEKAQFDTQSTLNPELSFLASELKSIHSRNQCDEFLYYLYALILKELGQTSLAISLLIKSINIYIYNWSAWRLLSELVSNENYSSINNEISPSFMKCFFNIDIFSELHQISPSDVIIQINYLNLSFYNFNNLICQCAIIKYHLRDFESSCKLFEESHTLDPYRLEGMDIYSNILYVKEDKIGLSSLAHQCFKIDKYSYITNCVIGNFYSLKGDHEKAIVYFKRSLKLNKKYLAAWTLMGHEYIELRNTSLAIDAYRHAVDVNKLDYRAWYGIGQAYEMQSMPSYAIYYFRKAALLKPFDSRMWNALAECYRKLDKIEDAIKCYLRADANDDNEGQALIKLSGLYQQLGDDEKAACYYEKVLQRLDKEDVSHNTIEALLFMSKYCKKRALYDAAQLYLNRLLDIGGTSKDEAKALLNEIRQIQHSN